jgi:hypothetical protein
MFHACEVKITKIEANSRPSKLFGKTLMKKVRAIGRKTRIGMDCRTSRIGTRTFSARRNRAAAVPYTRVKIVDTLRAMNIRSSDRAA